MVSSRAYISKLEPHRPELRVAGSNSTIETSTSMGVASIALGPGDLVTCTYSDRFEPPPHGLTIRKVTEGGVGRFNYTVTPANGGPTVKATATTVEEGTAVDANPAPLELDPGRYAIHESSPTTDKGHWALREVECGGNQQSTRQPIIVELPATGLISCTFHNAFVANGSIVISKVTRGALGSSGFTISPLGRPTIQYRQSATTTKEGIPTRAHGDATNALRLGRYAILDQSPEPHGGSWNLANVECNGEAMPAEEGQAEIALTSANPDVHCTFTNAFSSSPPPKPDRPEPPSAKADLLVTKRAGTRIARSGEVVTYRITVTNRGPDPAFDSALIDLCQTQPRRVHQDSSPGLQVGYGCARPEILNRSGPEGGRAWCFHKPSGR